MDKKCLQEIGAANSVANFIAGECSNQLTLTLRHVHENKIARSETISTHCEAKTLWWQWRFFPLQNKYIKPLNL